MTEQLSLFQARERAREGMRRAADHAEAIEPTWGDQAYEWLCRYAHLHHGRFISEQCTAWVAEQGFVTDVPKAWGQVFRRAAREGVIVRVGSGTSLRRHCSPTPLWERAA